MTGDLTQEKADTHVPGAALGSENQVGGYVAGHRLRKLVGTGRAPGPPTVRDTVECTLHGPRRHHRRAPDPAGNSEEGRDRTGMGLPFWPTRIRGQT